ncbi:MAG: hypothetical protein M9883_15715 [Methylobacteriaceae bacterium]|nr:hypothetical protein [Methylobacteriaceae bacterium]
MNEHVAIKSNYDFSAVRAAMQRYVDGDILAGVSWALLEGRDIVDMQAVGFADREAKNRCASTTSFAPSPIRNW